MVFKILTSQNLRLFQPSSQLLDCRKRELDLSSNSTSAESNAFPAAASPDPDCTEPQTMSRTGIPRNPIVFVFGFVSISCFLILTISILRLPDIPIGPYATTKTSRKASQNDTLPIGKFGEMTLEMLPEDLPFTVFLPSERAFARDLRLRWKDSLSPEKMNDTYAIISRVLGFSTVPRSIASDSVPIGKELAYDSISGFTLWLSKEEDGAVMVNGVRSETVDVRRKASVVHVMDGVVMDAEFQQAVQTEEEED